MAMTDSGVPVSLNLEYNFNNWIAVVDGVRPDIHPDTPIDIQWSDGSVWNDGTDKPKHCNFILPSDKYYCDVYMTHWRIHKPEQSLDEVIGQQSYPEDFTVQQELTYPQTTFKPSSEAQLRADEEARINNKLSEKLSTISDIASKVTRKNFSVADIKLVKDLLESVEEYESGR